MADPVSQTITQTNIPDYARPYVESMLGATQQQLFNTTPNAAGGYDITGVKPYQAYSEDPTKYFAEFSPLQKQAFEQAGPGGFANTVGQYMNPYLNQILAPQLAEANRQYDISGMQANAQATQAGAFGGGRQALMQAENERNRNMGLANIIGQGYNAAYNQAQNQYNTGLNQLLQMGGQQQQQQQNIINQAVQNYAMGQQYPQQQLAFMNSMLRGLPLQTATTSAYQAAPSTLSQVTGLGMAGAGAYGLANMGNRSGIFKKGGAIKEDKRPAGLMELALHKMG